jgi:hypothetical protein
MTTIITCAVCAAPLTEADRVEALPGGALARHVDFRACIRATLRRELPGIQVDIALRERAIVDVIVRAGEME